MQKRNISTQDDYMVSRGVNSEKRSSPLFLDLPYDDFNSPPHFFALPSPINMTTMTRHHA